MTNINNASNAYLNTLKQLQGGASGGEGAQATGGGSAFGDLVKNSLSSAIEAQHTSEKVSAQGLAGNADITDVLQALNDAEMALNTVLAIRDKVVQAYEQVMNTPI